MARTTASSLNAHRSSIEPPPRPTRTTSASPQAYSVSSAAAISAADARNRRLRSDLDVLYGKLASLNPTAVLTRGYAIALDRATGKAVRSVSEASPGRALDIRVSDGVFGAIVEKGKT